MHLGITENIWEGIENELLGIPLHADIPTARTVSPGAAHHRLQAAIHIHTKNGSIHG